MKNKHYNSNNRVVIDENGNVAQVTNCYPFGGVFSTTAYNHGDDLQPYKYNGKELDLINGLDWYDYGIRNYDAIVPMFTSIAPLCEKYYHISPYAYCANNPILFVDPDGKRFEFSPSCSPEFIEMFNHVMNQLKECGADDLYLKLADENTPLITIMPPGTDERTSVSFYEKKEDGAKEEVGAILVFNPDLFMQTENGTIMSPATIVDHEFQHIDHRFFNKTEFESNSKTSCGDYQDMEEFVTITQREWKTASKMGEIEDGGVTRTEHKRINPCFKYAEIKDKYIGKYKPFE